ncbi:hypothetical protein RIF29_31682 [Crotalaria pallida]|uniref:Uncharacterized protein n=1 Tax=Crotalaria pallida TaxID=3830 RepID=A0AAN9EI67_CROPI
MPSCHKIQTNNLNLKEELQLLKDDNNNNNYNHNKNIRKRGSSSSSSSSLVRRYRFKRAILVGKKGGSSTPVMIPMWKNKTTTSPPSMDHQHSTRPLQDKEVSAVSARKLAATLWEINDLPPSRAKKDFEVEQMRSCKETMTRSREKNVSLSRSGLLRPPVSADPSHSPASERMKGFEGDGHKRRVSALSHQHHHSGDYYLKGLDAHSSASLIEEVESQQRNKKNRLKEARSGLSTSKKLLKVLNQVCLREQQSSSLPLILALGSELDRVCHQIDQLIQEQHSSQNDIDHIMKHFAEEKAAWKRREREKIHNAIKNVAEELEVERKLRRQTERLNKKIAKEMANAKASHLKASKELEREKRAKEIMEQICDELARGIGEDRAQVQELKRESVKVREEVEREREMLQLADVLREERVQMKLSEAKYQFEEKNAFLEKLRNELEGYMRTKEENGEVSPDFKRIKDLETYIRIKEEENENVSPDFKRIKDLETYFNEINGRFHNIEKENDLDVGDGVEHDEGDDLDDGSDLHSIELNMDDGNRGYKWSYACENVTQNEPKRVSVDKESLGRKSLSEIIQWGSICFNKGTTSGGNKRDFGINFKGSSDHFDPERSIEFLSQARIQDGNDDDDDDKDDTESYSSIMGPQDCISFANPIQSLTLQHTGGEAGDIALTLEGENLK